MGRTAMLVKGGLFVAVMATVVFGSMKCRADRKVRNAAGPEDAWWIDAPAGPTLVVSDRFSGRRQQGHRLVAVDVATGKRLATRVLDHRGASCTPAVAGRMWCRLAKVELLDARTLATVTSIDGVLKAAAMPASVDDRVTVLPDAAYAVVNDGRIARIDAKSLAAAIVAAVPPTATTLSQVVPTQASCAIADESQRPATTTLLEPRFLVVGKVILAEHVTSLDTATARTKLARLDAKGHPAWDVEVGGRCQLARESSGMVVFATTDGHRRAHAVDLANGTMRWTLAFD